MAATEFHRHLKQDMDMLNMPPVEISKRVTDKSVIYNKNLKRLDFLAGEVYEDEGYWKLIMWANPEYDLEFDIPNNTIIRVPWPLIEVRQEVVLKINAKKNLY